MSKVKTLEDENFDESNVFCKRKNVFRRKKIFYKFTSVSLLLTPTSLVDCLSVSLASLQFSVFKDADNNGSCNKIRVPSSEFRK